MADFFQNLDPASMTSDPNAVFSLNPMNRPPVSQPDPATLDSALQRAAELGIQIGLPAGLAGLGGPLSLGLRTLGPAISAMIGGPLDSAGIGKPQGMPDNMLQGAIPDPEQAGLTAEQVLAEAAGKSKGKLGYGPWSEQNKTAGDSFGWDFQNPHAGPEPAGQIDRYNPARGTKERMADALADPQVGKVLRAAVQNGTSILPQNWYRTGPLYDVFQKELGDQAPAAYKRFMDIVAATSPKSSFPDNVRTASYYYNLDQTGQPIPDKPAPGYGSLAQRLHVANVREVQDGGMDPMDHPKPVSFSANLQGNEVPETIDTHKMRLIGMASKDPRFLANSVKDEATGITISPRKMYDAGKITMDEALKNPTWWDSAPDKNEYGAAEAYSQKMAGKMGLSTADLQGKQWVGAGGIPNYPTIKVKGFPETGTGLGSPPETALRMIAKRVQYTAYRMGVDPQVVLQKFVKGEIPLLSVGAGTIALGTAGAPQPASRDTQ